MITSAKGRWLGAWALSLCLATEATASPWDDALQREAAMLRGELAAMQQTREQRARQAEHQHAALQAALRDLSAELVNLRVGNDRLSRTIDETSPKAPRPLDLAVWVEEAAQGFGAPLVTPPSPGDGDAAAPTTVEQLFAAALHWVEERARPRTGEQTYFDRDGIERRGAVTEVGRVAAWGPAQEPLALVADHRWVTVPQTFSHQGGVFTWLVDPRHPTERPSAPRGVWATFLSGGPVMWPIALLGLFALVLAAERLLVLSRAGQNLPVTMETLRDHLLRGDLSGAREQAGTGRLGVVIRGVLAEAARGPRGPRTDLEDRAAELILAQRPMLERSLSLLQVIAMVAPLLGLLGTVSGMIATFSVITDHGTGDPRLLSGGISEALLTTELGLAVAIPTVLVHALLSRWAERILGDLELAAVTVLNLLDASAQAPSLLAMGDTLPAPEPESVHLSPRSLLSPEPLGGTDA